MIWCAVGQRQKGLYWALFQVKLVLLLPLQPSLNGVSPVFCFPSFQCLVIPAFGLDHFTGIQVLVHRQVTWFASACRFFCARASGRGLWIEQGDDVLQAESVVFKKLAQLRFELDFFLGPLLPFIDSSACSCSARCFSNWRYSASLDIVCP